MANNSAIISEIQNTIKQNGVGAIKGNDLQQVLVHMVQAVGQGRAFAGIATPSGTPSTYDRNVFWLATAAGTYTNFGGLVIPEGLSAILYNEVGGVGSYSYNTLIEIDDAPTSGSDNLVSSGAIYTAIQTAIQAVEQGATEIYDVSANNNGASYATLAAALALVPQVLQKGGISVKYIDSTSGKYVQYRLLATSWSTNSSDWEKAGLLYNGTGQNTDGAMTQKAVSNVQKCAARVISCRSINFNNATHQAEIGQIITAKQSDNSRLTINATNVNYNFRKAVTTSIYLVYDLSQSAYSFISAATNTYNQIVIASILIDGDSTATPNTSKVLDVRWCAFEKWFIDGRNGLNALINQYGEAEYWVDGNKWVSKSTYYSAVIIPITGASQLTVKANSSVASRIAFANTYDPSNIVSGTTTINGTANNSTPAAQTKTLSVPNTCNYIVVNAKYGGNNALPESLVIDGSEYMKDVQDALIDVSKTAYNTKNVIDEWNNDYLPEKSNAIRGAAMIVACGGINFNNLSHRVEVGGLLLANRSDSTRLTIPAANVDYSFNAASTTAYSFVYDFSDGTYKFVSTGTQNYNQVVLAAISISGNSSANPNTSKVNLIRWCPILQYYIDGVNPIVSEAMYHSVVDRNIHADAAVRATGKKAVSTDILPFSFIHISDIHTKGDNFKCFKNACEFYQHYDNIKAMIVTGDLVYDTFADQMTWYDEAITATTKPILNVIGNHDSGQYNASLGLASVSTDKQCYDKFIAPYVSNWGVVQPSDAATEGKSYYYKDYTAEKIRLVVVNEFETDYDIDPNDNTKLLYSRELRAMRQEQFDWLITTLSSTPDDYGVIVAYHQPDALKDENNEFVSFDLVASYRSNHSMNPTASIYANTIDGGRNALPAIIDAFKNKSSLDFTFACLGAVPGDITIECDFSEVQAEFICILCGHTHRDYIGHLADFPTVPILCVGADNLLYTSSFQPRIAGTPSEDLFNVVNIDRNRKTIKVIRIGSNASVTGQVREQMIMSYV